VKSLDIILSGGKPDRLWLRGISHANRSEPILAIDLSVISQENGAFKFWQIGQKGSIAADATRFSE
jgi:hypothetical protein